MNFCNGCLQSCVVRAAGELIGGVSPLLTWLWERCSRHSTHLPTHSLTRSLFFIDCRCRCRLFTISVIPSRSLFSSLVVTLLCIWDCCGCRSSAIIGSGNCIDHASKLGQRCWQQRFTMKTQTHPSPNVSLRKYFPSKKTEN